MYTQKSVHFCAKTFEKYFASRDYCVAQHNDSMCSVSNCKYHILVIAEKGFNDLMQKLGTFGLTYQLVNSIYSLFMYRFDGKINTKNGQVFDKVERAVRFKQRHKTVGSISSIAKIRLLRKKYKRHLLSSLQMTISTQTSRSVLQTRFNKLKRLNLKKS